MFADKKRVAAPSSSVGADEGQPLQNLTKLIIPENPSDNNPPPQSFEEIQRQMERMSHPDYLATISMDELYQTICAHKPPIIDGLLSVGTYLFVGAPKVGKSFLMAQLAYHVSTGRPLWGFPVRQGAVLYLALEDTHARLQSRLFQMFGVEYTPNLHLSIEAKALGGGLEGQLEKFYTDHPDTKLIIIDTLQKIREAGGDKYSYGSDYDIITKLKRFADRNGLCLLLVHHTRKQQSDDKFDMISGTNGLLGAADGAFLLQKEKRTDTTAILDISGRDVPDYRLHLSRDVTHLFWNLDSMESQPWEAPPDELLNKISTFITADSPIWEGTATQLAELLSLDMKPNKLSMRLNINRNRLLEEHGILYENNRTYAGRTLSLRFSPSHHDDYDGHDDKKDTPPHTNLSS